MIPHNERGSHMPPPRSLVHSPDDIVLQARRGSESEAEDSSSAHSNTAILSSPSDPKVLGETIDDEAEWQPTSATDVESSPSRERSGPDDVSSVACPTTLPGPPVEAESPAETLDVERCSRLINASVILIGSMSDDCEIVGSEPLAVVIGTPDATGSSREASGSGQNMRMKLRRYGLAVTILLVSAALVAFLVGL